MLANKRLVMLLQGRSSNKAGLTWPVLLEQVRSSIIVKLPHGRGAPNGPTQAFKGSVKKSVASLVQVEFCVEKKNRRKDENDDDDDDNNNVCSTVVVVAAAAAAADELESPLSLLLSLLRSFDVMLVRLVILKLDDDDAGGTSGMSRISHSLQLGSVGNRLCPL
jgi:hypothetical protein